jgi:predicted dehydrogenase
MKYHRINLILILWYRPFYYKYSRALSSMSNYQNMNRKDFLKKSTAAGLGLSVTPSFNFIKGRNDGFVRIGFIGVGSRGTGHLRGILNRNDVQVPAICDINETNARSAQKLVHDAGKGTADLYTKGVNDYLNLVARDDLDGILISTPWEFHVEQCVAGMKAGKYVAVEIPAAITVEGCWDLVNVSEATGMPCMVLGNTSYQRDVLAVLNMVRQGLFGELIHVQCGYQHNLLPVMIDNNGNFGPGTRGEAEWRTNHYVHRNGLLYPDHGANSAGHWLNINRGNRYLSLSAMATKARGLNNYIKDLSETDNPNRNIHFNQGDIVTVMLRTANGETVLVIHDTTLPRGDNNKAFRVQGTKGLWQLEANRIYLDGKSPNHTFESFDPYQNEFDSSLWKKYENESRGAGHGGKDFFIRNAFVEAIKRKVEPPLNVYDAATTAAIGPLSEKSVAEGGASINFPDFTRGKWMNTKPIFRPEELGY